MKYENEKYYGDKNSFAIRFLKNDDSSEFAFCHLIFSEKIIGDVNEPCYLPTWKNSVGTLKKDIENGSFKIDGYEVFKNKSDDEIFNLIWNENQDHRTLQITIDETIDAYLLSLIEKDGKLKFLWKGWREPCPEDQIGKLYSFEIQSESLVKIMENALSNI